MITVACLVASVAAASLWELVRVPVLTWINKEEYAAKTTLKNSRSQVKLITTAFKKDFTMDEAKLISEWEEWKHKNF